MDISIVKLAWKCVAENYPQLAGAALQVIGGATVLFRLLGSQAILGTNSTPSSGFLGNVLGFLSKIALNKS